MTSFTSTEPTPNAKAEHLLIVEVRGQLFGLPAAQLREVITPRPVTRIPGAPGMVRGLLNLRGSLVVVADVAARLSSGVASGDPAAIVLVEQGGKTLGLAVQDVRDVVALAVEPIDGTEALGGVMPPGDERASYASLCSGVGRLEDAIVIVLDVAALMRQVVA